MEEEISEYINNDDENKNFETKKNIYNKNISLLKEIDKIIKKSKNQLEEIKSKNQKDSEFYKCNKTMNNNISYDLLNKNNISINENKNNLKNEEMKESIKMNNNQDNINKDKDFELERLNLKLREDLIIERAKVRELNLKLKIKDKEISSLKKQLNNTQLNFYNKQKQYENILIKNNSKSYEKKNNYIIEYPIPDKNPIIIKSFFNFYNKYLELFNQLELIDNKNNMLIYNENDIFNNNIKNAKLIIDTFDILIEKLILENKESFSQKVKYKKNRDDIIINIRNKFDYIDNINTFKTIKSENIGLQNIKNDKKVIKKEIIKNNELNSLKMKNENE